MYGDKKSSKSSKASLRRIHKALEGFYSSETNNISDEEKQNESPDKVRNIGDSGTKPNMSSSHIPNEFATILEELKKHMKDTAEDTPKQLDTLYLDSNSDDLEDYEKWSVSECNDAIRTHPQKAYFRIGTLCINNNPIKARACFQEWQEIDPSFRKPDIIELIGDSIFKDEKESYVKAITFYEEATKLKPESTTLMMKQGRCYEKLKDLPKAIEFYEKAVEYNENRSSIPLFRIAWTYIKMKEFEKAAEHLKSAILIEPNNVEMLSKLGETLLNTENEEELDKAREVLIRAVKIDPNNAEAYMNLGRLYVKKSNFDLSLKWYKKAIRRTKDPSNAYAHLASSFSNVDKDEKVINLFTQLLSINKKQQNKKETKKIAIKQFKAILKKNPNFEMAKEMLEKLENDKK